MARPITFQQHKTAYVIHKSAQGISLQRNSNNPSAIESRMRWKFPAWGEVRTANETPGITPRLIRSSEGAAWAALPADVILGSTHILLSSIRGLFAFDPGRVACGSRGLPRSGAPPGLGAPT